MKPETRNILAVIVGCLVMVITGWVLFPLLKMAVINSYTMSLKEGISVNRVQLSIINLLWVSIAAFMGGFFACQVAVYRKIFYALLSGAVAAVILLLVQLFLQRFQWTDLIFLLMIIPLSVMGGIVRVLISNNKLPD